MRAVQPQGEKGSLRWTQIAVNSRSPALEQPLLAGLPGASAITWRSPLESDDFAEYRDADFLDRLGLERLAPDLGEFWPTGGPQWDALGLSDAGHILILEAKAHIGEFCSPPSQASPASRQKIRDALALTAAALGAKPDKAEHWLDNFYQYANRLAHLVWLRNRGVDAYLVLANFWGDDDMPGKATPEAWDAAYQVADYALGIPRRHAFSRYVLHLFPNVHSL